LTLSIVIIIIRNVAYGIPLSGVNAKHVYKDISAVVITWRRGIRIHHWYRCPEDPFALFLFIIVLDYALGTSISSNEYGIITLKRRHSSRHPGEFLADLDYADDIKSA